MKPVARDVGHSSRARRGAPRNERASIVPGRTIALISFWFDMKELERAKGIEPSYEAWEASVLPLNYARDAALAARASSPFTLLMFKWPPRVISARRPACLRNWWGRIKLGLRFESAQRWRALLSDGGRNTCVTNFSQASRLRRCP
jgi:hypothetical protein